VSVQGILVGALLVLAGVTAVISLSGVALMAGTANRLHYLAPVSTIGALAVAAAVVVEQSLDARGIKALIVLAILAGLAPVLVHATARAARVRRFGDWRLDRTPSGSSGRR